MNELAILAVLELSNQSLELFGIKMSSSGIRATSDRDTRKPILKDAASYISWSAKMETILDAEDCWEIVIGNELEPSELGWVVNDDDDEHAPDEVAEAARALDIKDWKRRYKKAASLLTQSVDDSLVASIIVLRKNPVLIWAHLAADFNTVTPAQLSIARRDFLNFAIPEDEPYLTSKQNFDDLLRRVSSQGGTMSETDQVQTLLGSLPEKFETIRDTFFAQTPLPGIVYIWERMFDKETSYKRREQTAAMRGEGYFQSYGRGVPSRGRGNRGGVPRGGGSGGGRGVDAKNEACFRCGEPDHWSRECPQKESVCT